MSSQSKTGAGPLCPTKQCASHTSSSWCHSSSTLLYFSFHDWSSSFYNIFLRMCTVQLLRLFLLLLSLRCYTIPWCPSFVSSLFSSPHKLAFLNSAKYGRAHWEPIAEMQGVNSLKCYLHLVLLPLVLSQWWNLPALPSTLLAICELCVCVFVK